jgi:hypothetical protein
MDSAMPMIETVIGKAWSEIPTTKKEFSASCTQFEWGGWNEACERLKAHRAGLAFNPKQIGEA